MATEIPVTIPEYLEAVFVSPDGMRMAVYRAGEYVQSDWKCLQIRMRREVTHPTLRVPWGELIVVTSICGIAFKCFGFPGLLSTGIVVWAGQRVIENVRREIETRKRASDNAATSSLN